ncbi:MAG: aspartate/glutamate racemase family protein [Thermodesulfobacteriota bacterium]|nr:aspartate/glutamate racemase family protein [Thermodesulfobacteriota bacterium]
MNFKAKKGQTSYGEAIGILMLDTFTPFIHGDVGNAASYDYPVRFKRVESLTVEKIFNHDTTFIKNMVECAKNLEKEGVKAITGDCGFMAIFQEAVKKEVKIPVFLSSLLQIPFIRATLSSDAKIGIITANSQALTKNIFEKINITDTSSLVIKGLEHAHYFREAAIEETGSLNREMVEKEVVSAAEDLVAENQNIGSLLLECSLLPPYSRAVQKATQIPVYDFLTMIDYVYASLEKKSFYNDKM